MENKLNLFIKQLAQWRESGLRVAGMMVLALFILQSSPLKANDYLEKQNHYSVMATGQDVIHFVVPVYAYGKGNDYYVHKTSYIYIDNITKNGVSESGTVTIAKAYSKRSADDSENKDYSGGKGSAYVEMKKGKAIVTSTYSGINEVVNEGESSGKMLIRTVEDDGCDHVTKLEFDWYPPTELNQKKFRINLKVYLYRNQADPKDNNQSYTFDWHFDNSGQNFTSNDNMVAPQLMTPFLYTVSESGAAAGFGAAAVPYMTFQNVYGYYSSLNSSKLIPVKERSGMIYVETTDTVQPAFSAKFDLERNATTHERVQLNSNTVNILPYHRIYDFTATAETDNTDTYTGNHVLTWNIKNPQLADLLDGDMFEIQRALKSDFSDAQQVTVTNMTRNKGTYKFVDNNRSTWTGNAHGQTETFDYHATYTPNESHVIYDQNGNAKYSIDVELTNEKVQVSSVPVYYRIRRASASVWGWNNELVKTTMLQNANYLAPLAATQDNYAKDADFENNHKVNFRFKIENSSTPPASFDDDAYTLQLKKWETFEDSVIFRIIDYPGRPSESWFAPRYSLRAPDMKFIKRYGYFSGDQEFKVPKGTELYFDDGWNQHLTIYLNHDTQYRIEKDSRGWYGFVEESSKMASYPYTPALQQYLIDSLKPLLTAKYQQEYQGAKAMWDNSAKLVVTRTIQETGQEMEFIVPPDSIRRQEDGSWIATFSDVADRACSHYSYNVRIDQSEADLHVFDSLQLQPKTISGPDLYFDESATITRFTATKGDASTAMKNGVLLRWQVNSEAVDSYVLTRVKKGSDASPDTLYRGDNTDYFDRTALPNVHYDYTVATSYSCNGKSTSNAATTEGWRTPYGEISGTIRVTDNSGMAGVKVVLQDAAGNVLDSMITNASGFYRFDSLTYDGATGTDFAIIPTSQYGKFSYNNTSAVSATVSLTVAEAVGSVIDFVNTSSTRLSGRVLYKLSTIPVPGAMFLLNGDTVRRDNTPVTTGTDGNFELVLPLSQPCKLQVFKPGHSFEGDGILHVEQGKDTFALTKPLDGVRFYDQTKVRLVGRVAGGNDQRDLQHGFGLGKNNLGDNLQLVLQLEGDNTAQLVHDPDDLSRDTMQQQVSYTDINAKQVVTNTLFEKKRIILQPDPRTGEYAVDLFPTKYKVVQATATGYATLFAAGQGAETFDLTNAPLTIIHDTLATHTNSNKQFATSYNAVYDRIYHNPVVVGLSQILYGIERKGYGEAEMEFSSIRSQSDKVAMYTVQENGTVNYLMGYPVFLSGRKYQFVARAYEEYFYNNNRNGGVVDRVAQRGGEVTIHNGLHSQMDTLQFALDEKGENRAVWLTVDQIDVNNSGTNALRNVSTLLKTEGTAVETTVFSAFVSGVDFESGNLTDTESSIVLLDIIRDPAGMGSTAWVDAGSTYTFGYSESFYWNMGVDITLMKGVKVTQNIGTVSAPQGAGTYLGSNFETSRLLSIPIPISHDWSWGYMYNYTVTTDNRISTSPGMMPQDVGAPADVFYGTTISQLAGRFNAVAVISDSLFQVRQPAINAGIMKVLGSGAAADGKQYYLVTGQKTALGSKVNNTFAYTQDYVINSIIPKLAIERSNLLMNFADSAEAQAYANATEEPVYWNIGNADRTAATDSIKKGSYKMICPDNDQVYTNRIAALDNMIYQWIAILYGNEKEKVHARMAGSSTEVGTYSISAGASFTHSDVYASTAAYNELPQSAKLWGQQQASSATLAASQLASSWQSIANFFGTMGKDKIGETVESALDKIGDISQIQDDPGDQTRTRENQIQEMGSQTNASKFMFNIEPTTYYMPNYDKNHAKTVTKNCGFSLNSDNMGGLTVAVYRARTDSVWRDTTAVTRDKVGVPSNDPDLLYGSYVFYTVAGSTYCPHEDEQKTTFYNPGTVISNETQWVCKPEMTIDTYEQSAVMPDKRAVFHVTLMNNSSLQTGRAAMGNQFDLSINPNSNPNGARITMDGQPLTQSIGFFLTPGVPVTKTLEVERGTVDDYENLTLNLGLADCPITFANLNFSVHFLPVSSPVEITSPRQNWIMNTLSPHDSIGYYLPVEIDGFDIHHKNFDHIEFQYKLSTESDDAWVNQCSFYADDSLYNLASGNKAMIENGRIVPFRFYGERDPKELNYDLRAVTFCRFGSGFVTKASPVMSGVKDTRPPVVFGSPEPANSILGIGDHLKLRFSEPIAGNWLDEDNNFQLIGITNETSPTTDASPHFDGTADSYAASMVNRSLANRSFTIDLMVKPTDPNAAVTFFEHGLDGKGITFGRTADNRLFLKSESQTVYSKPLTDKMLEFTRVAVTYNNDSSAVRFYAGTLDITATQSIITGNPSPITAPLIFGRGLEGNILETRIWTKALTQEEITVTNQRYLTGYERELMAYYRMNEGTGSTLRDRASGATLTMHNASWNLPKGISLALTKNDTVTLERNKLSRSAAYDATYLLWFRPTSSNGTIFRAGDKRFALEEGKLIFYYGDQSSIVNRQIINGTWHHLVLVVNRTYNNIAVYLDNQLTVTFAADSLTGIAGDMYFGGDGFEGNIDEFIVFEQALPKTFISEFGNRKPVGDEMGLMAYLPFEEQIQNPNGVLELVFSVNDQRIFKDANGNIVDKVVPLVVESQKSKVESMADKASYAPVSGIGLLSKLKFNWTYNNEELLVNLNMADYEINHQPVLVTVRDVEDLNGNPMPSPVMWMATVDRNALKWYNNELTFEALYPITGNPASEPDYNVDFVFYNQTGLRHQFVIESLPDWLTVSEAYGAINAISSKTVRFTFDAQLPPGVYSDYIYLTDENGLSEPLLVEYTVTAICPYDEVDKNNYPLNMSVCGEVKIGNIYDTDANDKVIALYRNECVGMANIAFDALTSKTEVFLTVHGNEAMNQKEIRFQLWQASTGKILELAPSRKITFAHGAVYGCGDPTPLVFTTSGSQTQNIALNTGWNWISFNLNLLPDSTLINDHMSAEGPWAEGDLIKNPASQQFCTYSEVKDAFMGTLTAFDYQQMYMVYAKNGNILRIGGDPLEQKDMHVTLRGNGQWSPLPCLLNQSTPVTEALADYYDHASVGDLIKAHDRFAYFSADKKWVGDLTAFRPGEGYLFRRMGADSVTINFYNKAANAPKQAPAFHGNAATNMTMIAKVQSDKVQCTKVNAYIGDELVGVATKIDSLYFLTIQSDYAGELRFETEDGTPLMSEMPISYVADAHHGSLKVPVILKPGDNCPYKIIENDHVVIIRNNEKYDVTGKKLK